MGLFSGFLKGGQSVTLPSDRTYTADIDALSIESRKTYQDFARQINGEAKVFTAKVFGGTSAGVGTYVTQNGFYILSGQMVDVYYHIAWTGHTGTGDLYVEMPFISNFSLLDYMGTIDNTSGGLNYTAGYTEVKTKLAPGTREATIVENGDNTGSQALAVITTAIIIGHNRFPIKIEY
jgi:hypothetical protein